MTLEYRVLGPIEVWADGRRLDIGGARQRRLLAVLLQAGGRTVDADRLVEIVWVGDPPARARNTLRTYIARARRALEVNDEAPLVTEPTGWRLVRDDEALDSVRFETLVSTARALSADPMATLAALDEALSLWRGDAFDEFCDEDWCAGEAVRLDELRLAAQEQRFEAMLGCGLYDDVIGELERFTEQQPLRDRSRGQLMVALYRAGRQVEAVRAFQEYRRYLDEEIGVEPSDELRSLEQRIVERDPALRQPVPDGRQLRGYRLGAVIGEGAFGRVYRAVQPVLGREVAIKVMQPELADDPDFIRRFDGEARIVARLEHPHVVPLFDYWREPGGAFLVMRYLRQGNAEQLVRREGPLPLERVVRLVEEIGGALAAAHGAGVIHCDVKPANILFDEHGRSYLGDFGIAIPREPGSSAVDNSNRSAVYLSPEQVGRGESTPRSDIYAFGAVLFELLTAQSPFPESASLVELVERKNSGELPDLGSLRPGLPPMVVEVIAQAMAPDPANRLSSVGDLVAAFGSATAGIGIQPSRPLGWVARNPYKGLSAFDEADTRDFFGREDVVEELDRALSRSRFVALVGPSGSGKSSLVRAGLVPRLRSRDALVAAMVPGVDPMAQLAQALLEIAPAAQASSIAADLTTPGEGLARAVGRCLTDGSGEVALVVDQFEELYTVTPIVERRRFLRLIADAVGHRDPAVRVLITVRADFYDRPLSDDNVGGLVQANTVPVAPLGPVELQRAITAPATQVGATVEPALVAALVADAAGAAMALPLIQYELTVLFEERRGDTLTQSAYVGHGGLGGAVARRADEIYDRLDEAGRRSARRLFGRLVAPGDRGDDTRRRALTSELAGIPNDLIEAYADARLLTMDRDPSTREPTVEISHEALISEWPRLRAWVDADREALRTMRHIATSAEAWMAGGRDPGELYRGARLLSAEDWALRHPEELNPTERAFLDSSIAARDAARAREQRRVHRLRGLAVSLATVAAIAMVAGLLALRQSQVADQNAAHAEEQRKAADASASEADRQRQVAEANAIEAERRAKENRVAQLVSQSSLTVAEGDPDLAILLALAAHQVSTEIPGPPQPGVVAALHTAVQASRLERIIAGGYSEIAVSPDGRTVALDHAAARNRLGTYDLGTGQLIAERTFDYNVGGLAYRPDGELLAVSFCCTEQDRPSESPAVELLDPVTLATVETLAGGWRTWRPSWSSDGRHVLVDGDFGVRVWRVGTPVAEWTIGGDHRVDATFLPGSARVVVADAGNLDVLDLDSGQRLARHRIPTEVVGLMVPPGGGRAAFVDSVAEDVLVVDLESGQTVSTIRFPGPTGIALSPDGASLAVGGHDDIVRVVALDTGESIDLGGHGTGVTRLAFASDGRLIVPTRDGGTKIWNVDPAGPAGLGNLAVGGRTRGGQARSDSELLVSVETGPGVGRIELLNTKNASSRTVAEFSFPPFEWPVFSPDGRLVAGYSLNDRIPVVVDVDRGQSILTLRPCETPRAIDSTNGWVLVDSSLCEDDQLAEENSSRTGFVDLATGELIAALEERPVFEAVLGPPGSVGADVVAYETWDTMLFRSRSTLEVLFTWEWPDDMARLSAAFAPDGAAVGVSAQTRQGIVFDVEAILDGSPGRNVVTVFDEMHTGPTQRVVPIGEVIVTTGSGTEVRQWDATTGELVVDATTDAGVFAQLLAMPDAKTLFYADRNGVLRRYLTDPDELVELARSRVQRGFSEAECGRFFPAGDCPA